MSEKKKQVNGWHTPYNIYIEGSTQNYLYIYSFYDYIYVWIKKVIMEGYTVNS